MHFKTLKGKAFFILVITSIVLAFSINYIAYYQLKSLSTHLLEERLASNSRLALDLLENTYPGDWSAKNGKLQKGDFIFNDNYQLVDKIKHLTGDDCTLFLGDKRISTTIQMNGQRRINTTADNKVVQAVLKEGKTYIKPAQVVGVEYLTIYTPIKDKEGNIIGMFFLGSPSEIIKSAAFKGSLLITLVLLVIISLLCFLIWLFIVRNIMKTAKNTYVTLERISQGDLSFTLCNNFLESEEELAHMARALNNTLICMKNMIKEVKTNTEEGMQKKKIIEQSLYALEANSGEVASSIEQVAKGASEQAKDLQESLQEIDELSKNIEEIAGNTSIIYEHIEKINTYVKNGHEQMLNLNNCIKDINTNYNQVARLMDRLKEAASQINNITSVMTAIAEQTNLLSLNASIEAARAGEHGRGFAVVAAEIAKLAENSKKSAKEIADLIHEIVSSVDTTGNSLKDTGASIAAQMKAAEATIQNFGQIVASVEKANPLIENIYQNINKTKTASRQLVTNLEAISAITEQNSASSEEVSASSEEMAALISNINAFLQDLNQAMHKLESSVARFKL